MKFGPFQIIRHSAEAAAASKLADSPAFASGRLVLPTGGEYYQLLPKLTPTQIRAWLYAWLQGDWTSGYDIMQVLLDTWPRARKNLHEVREAAATARFTVHPAALEGEEPSATAIERANFVRQQLGRFNPEVGTDEKRLNGFLYDATDALVMGVALQEVLWDRHTDGSAFVRATTWVTPRRIGYTASHKLGLRYPNTGGIVAPGFTPSPGPAQELELQRFVLAQYQTCSGPATKQSLLRPLVWWWGSMIWGRDWMLKFAEQFGLPWVDVGYDRNINPTDLAAMKAGAAAGGVNTHIFHPTDATIKLIESQKNGKDNPQMALIDYADHCADLLILGQTGTGDAKQSSGRAQVQALAGIRRERVQAVADWLGADPGAQLCGLITEVNYGDREETPLLKADFTEPEEPLAMAQRDQVIVQTVPVPKNWYYLRHNVPVPRAGEETIGGQETGDRSQKTVNDKAADITGAAAAEQKVETELDAMRARLAALEASSPNQPRGKSSEASTGGSFISGETPPDRLTIAEANNLLTKGDPVQDAQGRTVIFGQRLKDKLESKPGYEPRKKLVSWGQEAVRSGEFSQHVKEGELRNYYAKVFRTKDEAVLVVVDSKDGQAFNLFHSDVPYLKGNKYLQGSRPGRSEQPLPGTLQAIAAAGRLLGYWEFTPDGENVNFLEAAGADRRTQSAPTAEFAAARAADFAPFVAKYGPLLKRLETALAMHDEPRAAELAHLKPELEAMLADQATLAKVLKGSNAADLLGKMLSQEFFNALAKAKQPPEGAK